MDDGKINKTFSTFDKYGLKSFADKLTLYLQVESKFVDESYVLSLNSEFGSGKSTFFEMWSNDLKTTNSIFQVVYINAWESDFQGDPLLAINFNLLKSLNSNIKKEDIEPIKETTGKLCKFASSLGNDFIQNVTGLDIIKALEHTKSQDGTAKPGNVCFQLYQEKHKLFENLKKQLRELTTKCKSPVLIIIDELDRCHPHYAIEFLETIKHIFDIRGIIFVIGVDKGQLASSAKALFGQQLDFNEYYRKFANRNVNLPVKNERMTRKFCEKLIDEYLGEEAFAKKKRFSYAKHDSYRSDNITDLCDTFSLNARQIHEFFRIISHVLSVTKKSDCYLLWGWQVGTYFMVALSIKNFEKYLQIGTDSISLPEFTAFLKNLTLFNGDKHDGYWWATLLYLGTFGNKELDKLEIEFQKLGVWNSSGSEEKDFQKQMNYYYEEAFSGRRNNKIFSQIYQMLEGLRTFERD